MADRNNADSREQLSPNPPQQISKGFTMVKDDAFLLIQKILVWLPVKSLGRFKRVSKSWYALIESPFFIDLHTTTNNNNSSSKYILLTFQTSKEYSLIMISSSSESVDDSVSRSLPRSTNHDDQEEEEEDNQLVFKVDGLGFLEFGDFSKNVHALGLPSAYKLCEFSKTVVGSCNGLVCLYDNILNEVSLWNPATRQFKILPRAIKVVKDHVPKRLVGFGFDVETKDYKVLLLTAGFMNKSYYRPTAAVPTECICRAQVYSLSTDSWRLLEGITSLNGDPFSSFPSEVVCLNGSCFFLAHFFHSKQRRCIAENDRFIISFDFTKEIFTTMDLPFHHRNLKLYLSCFGDKMALFTVWCNPPPPADGSYYPDRYELPPRQANFYYFPTDVNVEFFVPEGYFKPPCGIDYSQACDSEAYSIWVLDEHVSSNNVNKKSWRQFRSFLIEHQIPGEWTSPSCISNDGEFVLLETRNSNGLGKKMKLYNLVAQKVKKDFLSCSRVMSKAYAYKPSLVKLIGGSSQQPASSS